LTLQTSGAWALSTAESVLAVNIHYSR